MNPVSPSLGELSRLLLEQAHLARDHAEARRRMEADAEAAANAREVALLHEKADHTLHAGLTEGLGQVASGAIAVGSGIAGAHALKNIPLERDLLNKERLQVDLDQKKWKAGEDFLSAAASAGRAVQASLGDRAEARAKGATQEARAHGNAGEGAAEQARAANEHATRVLEIYKLALQSDEGARAAAVYRG